MKHKLDINKDWTITKVVPKKTETQIEKNKSKYGRRIKQLNYIINDKDYIPVESVNSYHGFIRDMYLAMIGGRKITPKMELAITKIVRVYAKHLKKENDPVYRKTKSDFIEESVSKIHMIKRLLYRANYTDGYKSRSEYFLQSVENQVMTKGKLSVKQRKALNSMYKRFEKRIEKHEKVEKKIEIMKKDMNFPGYVNEN
tara:strand:+ start:99 stop:695 length:597 start_codon:yes stop_codon:yes gene_type:complete